MINDFDLTGEKVTHQGNVINDHLPKHLRAILKALLEAGAAGIPTVGFEQLKRNSVHNYMGDLRNWFTAAGLPLRILSTTGSGAPWETITCGHCGHTKKFRPPKGRPKGRFVLEPIPQRQTAARIPDQQTDGAGSEPHSTDTGRDRAAA